MKKKQKQKGILEGLESMSGSFTDWIKGDYSLLDDLERKPKGKKKKVRRKKK